jgi:hypothetical protein
VPSSIIVRAERTYRRLGTDEFLSIEAASDAQIDHSGAAALGPLRHTTDVTAVSGA